ncbi:MAG: hypothetical protein J0L77_05895 [Alphaproteobacteria bacterium]|nr:hypothetical protein [Alphaproteobacteria bacterium]
MFRYAAFFCLALIGFGLSSAMAQDTDLQGYQPPPLFGAPPTTQQRPDKPVMIEPTRSPAIPYEAPAPQKDKRPVITPQTSSPRDLPTPSRPGEKADKKKPESMVKGPVEMRPAPASRVDSAPVADTPIPAVAGVPKKTMLEQHHDRLQAEKSAEPEASKPALPVANLASPIKKTITYTRGALEMTPENRAILNQDIMPVLKGTSARLEIRSYATPEKGIQNSDRRMALNRALFLRSELIRQGIPADRMDVRALGDKSETPPADRIDLILSP